MLPHVFSTLSNIFQDCAKIRLIHHFGLSALNLYLCGDLFSSATKSFQRRPPLIIRDRILTLSSDDFQEIIESATGRETIQFISVNAYSFSIRFTQVQSSVFGLAWMQNLYLNYVPFTVCQLPNATNCTLRTKTLKIFFAKAGEIAHIQLSKNS